MSRESESTGYTLLGVVSGHFGVRGWVRIHSYTRPASEILQYVPWTLLPGKHRGLSGRQQRAGSDTLRTWRVVASREQKNGLVVQLDGVHSRDDAESLIGLQIVVPDGEMPALPEGEYYWSDLVGLTVVNIEGDCLGVVDHLVETGANDVLVVRDESGSESLERLIPWGPGIVDSVDFDSGELRVDWGLDF